MKHFLLSILLLAFPLLSSGSLSFFNFQFSTFTSPWTGGLNACQFGRMDLDGDGVADLVVFDRHGNRLLCFINNGGAGEIDYRYTDVYDGAFPEMDSWVVFADYDGDGHEDIFTYSKGWAGIKVFRNVSTPGNLAFEAVVDTYLTSWQGGGEVNILATEADYPAIVDVDGDGDLDLLTFGVMGTFIEKHVNRSVERYGCRDSLVFERTDSCWGRVAESEENNLMYLDTCLFGYGMVMADEGFRHRGATVTVRDMTGDGLLDLILADVDYPGLTLMVNGGDPDQAVMVSQTMDFPSQHPVRLNSMPVPFLTDIDNDGVDDLLVSPFDPDPMASEGTNSVWLYLNRGTNSFPDFQLVTKAFLQETMLDVGTGAYPVVVDLDGNGLVDVVVGTIGDVHRQAQLTWLKNVGTTSSPVYSLEAFPWPLTELNDAQGLVPAFADLDGDGKMELLVGTAEGPMMLYDDDGLLIDGDFLHYGHRWSAPCFFDVDSDGITDLVVGDLTGKLTCYRGRANRNDGEVSLTTFELISEFWGEVDVRDYSTSYYGYSIPSLFRMGNETLLIVGSESGSLFLFDGVTLDAPAVFRDASDRWQALCDGRSMRFGMRTSATLADLNGDGRLDVVVGNFGGGLQLFNTTIQISNIGIAENIEDDGLVIFPNPVSSQLHIISKQEDLHEVRVIDAMGRVVRCRRVEGRHCKLDVEALPSGSYLLVLMTDRGGVSRMVLKR